MIMFREKKIRVLFFEPYPMGLGGNFVTQRYILDKLDKTLFSPMVLAPVPGIALDEFKKIGIECFIIPPNGQLSSYGGIVLKAGIFDRIRAGFDILKYNWKLSRFLRSQKIDVVYANCVRAEMSIGLAARLAGVPTLLYIKGELDNPVIDRLSFFLASKVLFFSEGNKNDKYKGLVNFFKKKIGILPIGLDPKGIAEVESRDKSALKRELGIDSEYTNVIVLAQLYPPKGQHFVLQALERLVGDFPNVRLYLLGDHVIEEYKSYKVELERFVLEGGLEKNVLFTGWRKDALDVVSLMDIMIHPSLAEGFGRAVLESMALGKPVIASRIGGLREAIKDGENGFLVSPGNVNEIEQRWRQLLVDTELRDRLGKAAKATVYSEYLIDDKVVSLANIWKQMVEKK